MLRLGGVERNLLSLIRTEKSGSPLPPNRFKGLCMNASACVLMHGKKWVWIGMSLSQHLPSSSVISCDIACRTCPQIDDIINLLGVFFDGRIESEIIAIATFLISRDSKFKVGRTVIHWLPCVKAQATALVACPLRSG